MKKVILIFSVFVAIFLMIACEKDMDNPVLDTGQSTPPTVQSPADGTTFELLQVNEMDSVELFSWSAAQFNVENLPDIRYSMQVDLAGNDFANPVNLFTTTATSRQYTVAGLNMALISAGLPLGATSTIEARIFARVSDASEYDNLYSTPITLTVTTYEVMVKPIYLLGSGTTVGWSNTDALEMAHLAESRFARVEHLEPGEEQFIKFISVLGQWAPQWGSDESATPESGPTDLQADRRCPRPTSHPGWRGCRSLLH